MSEVSLSRAFRLTLPQGWTRLDLTGDLDSQLEAILPQLVADAAPTARAALTEHLRAGLRDTLLAFQQGGATCAVLPVQPMADIRLDAFLVVLPLAVPEDTKPLDLLLSTAATDPTATLVDLDDMVAIRTTSEDDITANFSEVPALIREIGGDGTDVTAVADLRVTSRKVRYQLGVLDDPDRWLDVLATTNQSQHPESIAIADATIQLMDAIIESLRWTR